MMKNIRRMKEGSMGSFLEAAGYFLGPRRRSSVKPDDFLDLNVLTR